MSPELSTFLTFLLPVHEGDVIGQGLEVAPCPPAVGGRRRAWAPLARHGGAARQTWYSPAVPQLCSFFLARRAARSARAMGQRHNTDMDLIRPLGGRSAFLLRGCERELVPSPLPGKAGGPPRCTRGPGHQGVGGGPLVHTHFQFLELALKFPARQWAGLWG